MCRGCPSRSCAVEQLTRGFELDEELMSEGLEGEGGWRGGRRPMGLPDWIVCPKGMRFVDMP